MKETLKHADCRNYAALDVVKGICHLHKTTVLADETGCEHLAKLPKCKHCRHYSSGKSEFIGTCNACKSRPMTYPDLITVTCEHFVFGEE